MKRIYTCTYQEDALVFKSMLDSAGIPAELMSGGKLDVNPLFNVELSGFTVLVPDEHEEDALALVQAFRHQQGGTAQSDPAGSNASGTPASDWNELVKSAVPAAIRHRRALHAIPEIGLALPRTIDYISTALRAAGYKPVDCGYGLFADLGGTGPLVAIRADMDGLPVEEQTGLDFASSIPGQMHACAHDVHSAALLALAEALATNPPTAFRLRFLFQAGEEGFFGARHMIEAGCLSGVSAIVGAHAGDLSEELSPGQAGFMTGPMMASSDRFGGTFIGQGGHGSAPHQTRDPIPALAQFVLAAQTLRSRNVDQRQPVVVSICQVEAGTAFNIIPSTATFKGTARTFSDDNQAKIREGLERLCRCTAEAHQLRAEFEWLEGYPPLVNDQEATELAMQSAAAVLGTDRVRQLAVPSMGGEDFAYYLQKIPGCFWFLNTQNPQAGINWPNHHARFTVDESHIGPLMAVNLAIAETFARRFG